MRIVRASYICIAFFFAFFLAVLRTEAQPAPADAWQEYKPADSSYRIEMPGTPKEVAQNAPQGDTKMSGASLRYNKGALIVIYSAMAADRVKSPPDKTYDQLRDTIVASGGGKWKLLGDQHETVGSLPARRLTIDSANGLIMTERLVASKGRIYQIMATGPQGFGDSPEVVRFLNSFTLTP
jgi:hypothetical protein